MSDVEPQEKAKLAVLGSYNSTHEDPDQIKLEDMKVVWFAKVLQNWKCLIFNTEVPGCYFEVTYNGDRVETYVDTYVKYDNQVFSPHGQ